MNKSLIFAQRFFIAICIMGIAFFVSFNTNSLYGQNSCVTVYTNDADFDQGNLLNLNHDSPNNNQLQLNDQTSPPPFIWVACSDRGTVVRIDVNTGAIIGEYKTAPDGRGKNPSRTTVDLYGNVWIGNRAENSPIGEVSMGSVIKIGVTIGGTRCDADGTPNPAGEYLKPPFIFNTAVDRNGDGLIKTSMGLGDIRPWLNDGGADDAGGVSTAEDEAILIYARTPACEIRHVSIDANNDVWVGGFPGYAPQLFNKLDGTTGAVLATIPSGSIGCGGYGGLIDGNGVLWSASLYQNSMLRYDFSTNTSTCVYSYCMSYGMAVDKNGSVLNALFDCEGINKINPDGTQDPGFPVWTGGSYPRGVAVTPDNHIWIANSGSNTVTHMDNNGNILKIINVGGMPTGVAVDANGKVWVTNYGSSDVMRIDPAGGGDGLGAVNMTVGLGGGAGPYNYSDMTGAVAVGVTSLQGTWNVVKNSGAADTDWGKVSWSELVPTGTAIKVEVRAANTEAGLAAALFSEVSNGVSFCNTGIGGQYIEIRVTLSRNPFISATPILYDMTLESCDYTDPTITVSLSPSSLWPPNHKLVDITATVNVDDNCGTDDLSYVLTSITSNEPDNGLGDGDKPDDIQEEITGTADLLFKLRAERAGGGTGRIYTVTYTVTDGSGNQTSGSATVTVPKNQPKGCNYDIENLSFGGFNIYPNPADEILYVNAELEGRNEVSIRISNLLGNEVYSINKHGVSKLSEQINIKGLSPGIYVLEVNFGAEKLICKLIKN